jgi:hypothetical protein
MKIDTGTQVLNSGYKLQYIWEDASYSTNFYASNVRIYINGILGKKNIFLFIFYIFIIRTAFIVISIGGANDKQVGIRSAYIVGFSEMFSTVFFCSRGS